MHENIIALGEWQVQHLRKLSDFKTCEGIGKQCYSKTSFAPHTRAPRPPPALPASTLPCGWRVVTKACLGGGFVA